MNHRTFSEVYRAFEDKFRGERELISKRLRVYEPLVQTIPAGERKRAIDLGSGRGEWLALTREWGFAEAVGVEPDVSMHEYAAPGVELVASDALTYLEGIADGSVQLISAFHVIEHVTADYGFRMICEMHRVLAEDGVMILETPNPENLMVGLWSFHLDPTHNRPIPPALLEFLVVEAGFVDSAIVRFNGVLTSDDYRSTIARLTRLGPDYSIVGVKREASVGKSISFSLQFSQASPANYEDLIELELDLARSLDDLKSEFRLTIERQLDLGRSLDDLKSEFRLTIERQDAIRSEILKQRDEVLNSQSWRLTQPLRSLTTSISTMKSRLRNFRTAATERRLSSSLDSISRQLVRSTAQQAFRVVSRSPALLRALRPIFDRSPSLKRRLRMMLLPRHLADAIKPFPRWNERGLSLTATERLVADRLEWAETVTNADADHSPSVPGRSKKRLAYHSPLPPERSGIADYSAQLLPALADQYDVTVICADPSIVSPELQRTLDIRDVAWFERNAWNFDRVVYHIGNSLSHHHMLPVLRKIPGVVVLHDFYLSGLLAYLEIYGGWGSVWTQALLKSHGYSAVRLRVSDGPVERAIDAYPASFDVIAHATGIITHSEFSKQLARKFYPACHSKDWHTVPLCRSPTQDTDRNEARQALGLAEDEFVVCSFGFVVYTKLNHRLLDAWLSSPLADDPKCRLIFVGETHQNDYSTELLNRIRTKGRDRISITGFVEQGDYARYLSCADVGVQLRAVSRGETSAAVLDCLAYGLPTIVNANGSMAELPSDKVKLLPDHFTDVELKGALVDLYSDRQARENLGTAAADYVRSDHSITVAAERYRTAIEDCYEKAAPLFDHTEFLRLTRETPAEGRGELKFRLGTPGMPRPAKRFLVDVSALVQVDLRTGIQRVVRAVLLKLFQKQIEGYRIEPIWLNNENGEWRYHHARRFTINLLSGQAVDLPDDPVETGEGDVFLGLDYFAHGVIGAWNGHVFEEWRRRGVEINFVVYDVLPLTLPQYFPDDSTQMHDLWLNALHSISDRLICISAAVADDVARLLQARNAPSARTIDIVPWTLGADLMSSAPTSGIVPTDHERLQHLSRNRSFLMVGTIEPRKGHRDVLDAFERRWAEGSKDLLVLVGSAGWKGVPVTQSRGLPDLIRRLREHPELGRRLVWFETASDELLEKIYGVVTALVSASEGEGFGLPLVEGAQHGLPLIVRDLPVFREVAGEHAFFFKARNPKELAIEIDRWATLYESDAHPASAGINWLTWEESTDRLLASLKVKPQQ